MINRVIEELRNFESCLIDEQLLCDARACIDFCGADFSRGKRMAIAKMTAPKPLLDKALSKGGGGLNVNKSRNFGGFVTFLTQARLA